MSKPPLDPRVERLEGIRKAAGVTPYAMRKRAGVSSSTYHHWMTKGAEPKRGTIQRCEEAIARIVAEKGTGAHE